MSDGERLISSCSLTKDNYNFCHKEADAESIFSLIWTQFPITRKGAGEDVGSWLSKNNEKRL